MASTHGFQSETDRDTERQTSIQEAGESKPYTGPDATTASFREHLKHVPKWSGDDLHELLEEVIQSRSQVEFWELPARDS